MSSPTISAPRQMSRSNQNLSGTGLFSHLSPESTQDFWNFGFGERRALGARAIHHPFETWALAHPHDLAVSDASGRELTYGQLNQEAEALAARLRRLGVAPGDRVGLFITRGVDMVIGILGTLKCGAAWVPQDIRHSKTSTLEHIVSVADLRVVLTTSAHTHAVPAVEHIIAIDTNDHHDTPTPSVRSLAGRAITGDDVAVVIFTSGTTGVPNGVEVTHSNLVNTILDGPASLGIQPGMRVAGLLNIAFDMAVWEVFGALTHGANLELRGSDIQATAARADVVIATPSVLGRLDHAACSNIKIVAVAGERCPETLARTWSQTTTFHNSCGPTEVSIVNTVHQLNDTDELTIGAPIQNTTVYVLDENQRPVETGEIGEMWAGGACVTRGYLGNPELTADRYREDPFRGGMMFRCRDLVSWTPEGRLLHHGRTDDQVKVRGGFRVELDAVTTSLELTPGVARATTLFHEGELIGVIAPTDPTLDHHQLTEAAKTSVGQHNAYFYIPQRIIITPDIPLTDRGKVDKRTLLTHILNHTTA